MSSSIVYPDGVPLMALLLKPFNAWLPEHFQYFGIWILICYMLQVFFFVEALSRITDRVWHKVFATLFFVLAPPFVLRLFPTLPWDHIGSSWLLLYLYSCTPIPFQTMDSARGYCEPYQSIPPGNDLAVPWGGAREALHKRRT